MRSDKMCALAGLNEKKLRNFFLVHEKFFEKKKNSASSDVDEKKQNFSLGTLQDHCIRENVLILGSKVEGRETCEYLLH